MRRTLAVATGIAAGVTALALIATPTLAQAGPWSGSATEDSTTCPMNCDGRGDGTGYGMGRANGNGNGNGNGAKMGRGSGTGQPGGGTVASGTLTSTQKAALASMAEEEKLAHDLYTALAATYPASTEFARIAASETRHLTAVRTLLTRYAITDPTVGLASGDFASARFQTLYDSLLAGATTSSAARAAGVTVEKADIADLTASLSGVTAPDVLSVLTHLRTASQRHLTAFGG